MKQACHHIAIEIAGSRSAQYVAAVNQFGHSKVLHLLGPPWARTFRCVWMLEELNEERKSSVPMGATNAKSMLTGICVPSTIPYYLIRNARPLSEFVRRFHPTGKVPVLMEIKPQESSTESSSSACLFSKATTIDDDDAFVLSESSAINTYLYDQYGIYNTHFHSADTALSTPLVPSVGSPLRGQYDALVACICTELDAQGLWMHRKHFTMAEQLTQQQPNHLAVMHAKEHFKRINQYLASLCSPFLLGQNFSAADILYVHCLDWSRDIGWNDTWPVTTPADIESLSNTERKTNGTPSTAKKSLDFSSKLLSYVSLCHSRPAYQRAVAIRDGPANQKKDKADASTFSNHSKL
jgi:glutathione S-transferase